MTTTTAFLSMLLTLLVGGAVGWTLGRRRRPTREPTPLDAVEVLADLGHELRTPLVGLEATAEHMHAERADAHTERLLELVQQVAGLTEPTVVGDLARQLEHEPEVGGGLLAPPLDEIYRHFSEEEPRA